jgi:hypothetical protein
VWVCCSPDPPASARRGQRVFVGHGLSGGSSITRQRRPRVGKRRFFLQDAHGGDVREGTGYELLKLRVQLAIVRRGAILPTEPTLFAAPSGTSSRGVPPASRPPTWGSVEHRLAATRRCLVCTRRSPDRRMFPTNWRLAHETPFTAPCRRHTCNRQRGLRPRQSADHCPGQSRNRCRTTKPRWRPDGHHWNHAAEQHGRWCRACYAKHEHG